jgi:hypothetical protein
LLGKSVLLTALAVAVATVAVVMAPWGNGERVQANPPGAPEGLKLAYKFNLIALPEGTSPSCGQGHKVFMERGSNPNHIVWTLHEVHGIHIVDCLTESIDDTWAHIHADAADTYIVFVRILGPNADSNTLSICRNIWSDDPTTSEHDELCELGDVNLERKGTDRTTFNGVKLFGENAEGELWHLEQGTGYRIAEIRLYRDP